MSDIAERVKKIVVEHLGVEADKVTDKRQLHRRSGRRRLDTVELVMAFEEEFGVEIPDDAAETHPDRRRRREVHREGQDRLSRLRTSADRGADGRLRIGRDVYS